MPGWKTSPNVEARAVQVYLLRITKCHAHLTTIGTKQQSNNQRPTNPTMPLNLTQRKALREALSKHIDLLFTDLAAEQYLPQVIEDIALSRPEVIAYLKQHRHLIQDLVKVNNLEASVRKELNTLLEKLDSEKPIIPQSLLYRHPNYNPMNTVEMKQFGDRLVAEEVEEPFRASLIALRELYLGMRPFSDTKSEDSQGHKYRIGGVPLELDKLGDTPPSGEISAEVLEYITLRL